MSDTAEKQDEKSTEVTKKEINDVREFIGNVRSKRLEWEIQSYVNVMFKQGKHFVNDQGIVDVRDPAQLRRHVNKFRATLRKMKNSILYNDPIVDVLPEPGKEGETTSQEIDAASCLVISEYRKNGFKKMLRSLVDTAALKSWCMGSVMPSDQDDQMVDIQVYDSMDVFFDHPDMCKALMVVISSSERKDYLKSRGYKNIDKAAKAENTSHSFLKNQFDAMTRSRPTEDSLLIDQVYRVEYDEKDGEIVPDTAKIVTFTIAGETIIKDKETLKDYTSLDQLFRVVYLEEDPFIHYPAPWMSDVIPLQRSLNDASENIDTALNSYAKVRVLQRRGDSNTVQMLEDRHLQKIAFEGEPPVFGQNPPVPQDLYRTVQMRKTEIEDVVGQHGASSGADDPSVNSGRDRALRMAGDMDNLSEPAENIESFLEWAFEKVLDVASKNITKTQKVYGNNKDEAYTIIGDSSFDATEEDHKNAVKIKPFKNIQVKMVPGSAFNVSSAIQSYLQLLPVMQSMGLEIEAKALYHVLIRTMSVGAMRDLARFTEKEQAKIDNENADLRILKYETMKLMRGEPVMASPHQPHQLHVQMKMQALQEFLSQFGEEGKNSEVFKEFMENIATHQSMLQNPPTEVPSSLTPPEAGVPAGQ